ncbi:helix-turn-helix domain-containing protein [Mycolicibacterium iranicum]|uniref:Helix-turn-helix domain-containing protein n=1 Tax=Mycolicibacterium iranicum TaxID=912594 RepID=A0ABT4HLC3_MYCIR|nr:helix-turn-helix domain-containing protein [Mycolicibacterium iranicum]MCZ0730472.1 helix-turn-helix domain-containing protein [Mycolicibacterium iranicum]
MDEPTTTRRPPALTPAQVADELGYCRDWVYALLRSGALPGVKLRGGRRWLVRPETIDAILAGELHISPAEGDDDQRAS